MFDQWKIPMIAEKGSIAAYVQCDCGELAKRIRNTYCFECDRCKKKYVQKLHDFVDNII